MPQQSRALLYRLLQGETPTAAEIQGLVKAFAAQQELEGQLFDVKSGLLLQNKQSDELRAAVCGFANAEGGFLLIGYNESAKAFDYVAPVGKLQPEQWVADSLGPMAHMIPPPRYATVDVGGGPVLLVAVERARALAHVMEDGPVYYLRFGHQTKPMPQSLVTDLMLGRKARPHLLVRELRLGLRVQAPEPIAALDVTVAAYYENDTFIFAKRTRAGLVGWASGTTLRQIPEQLLRAVEFKDPPLVAPAGTLPPWNKHHSMTMRRTAPGAPWVDVLPFDTGADDLEALRLLLLARNMTEIRDPISGAQVRDAIEVKAGLYLLAEDAEPSWWQLTMRYDHRAAGQLSTSLARHFRWEPCFYSRPVVSVRFLNDGEPVELPEVKP